MELKFLYHPVKDLRASLLFYHDMGFKIAWQQGAHTVAMSLPNSNIKLLLEDDELNLTAGGIFVVENVDDFYEQNKERYSFVKTPCDIPPGRYAIYQDLSENLIRIIDLRNER